MGEVLPMPRRGDVFADVRGQDRSMRVSCHADRGVVVVSLWAGTLCRGSFRLAAADVDRLISTLAAIRVAAPGADPGSSSPPTSASPTEAAPCSAVPTNIAPTDIAPTDIAPAGPGIEPRAGDSRAEEVGDLPAEEAGHGGTARSMPLVPRVA